MNPNLKYRVERINPILNVRDIDASVEFYEKLGFENAEWAMENFTMVSRDDRGIYLCRGRQGNPGTWVWLGFDGDIYELYEELKNIGVKVAMPPSNYSWALELSVEDPDGHIIRFGTEPDPSKPYLDL